MQSQFEYDATSDVPAPTKWIPPKITYEISYQRISPYNPEVYKCTGYRDEVYEYFDGSYDPGCDQRFSIDIDDGSMDR